LYIFLTRYSIFLTYQSTRQQFLHLHSHISFCY